MNTMYFYLWLMPVLLMIHEFEEIIMIEVWFKRNKDKIRKTWPKRLPFGLDNAGPFLTPSISIGIFSQFILIILAGFFCAIIDNYYVWFGLNIGFLINTLLLHVRNVVEFKGYTPGFITSVILFFPSIWILFQANTLLHYGAVELILSTILVNLILGFAVFKLLHKSMISWSESLVKYAKGENRE